MVNFITELIFIGIIGGIISLILSVIFDTLSINKLLKIFIIGALTGIIIHSLFQMTGINKWYCYNSETCKNV